MNFLLATLLFFAPSYIGDSEQTIDKTEQIESVEITASVKQSSDLTKAPLSFTNIGLFRLEREGISSIGDISAIAPNFYMPEYGSKATSSIYVRGFGSRIDQPVMGVNIDDVPLMNKNMYDFDLFDIRKISILRGPQSTLYGRNTSGGVMNISTLSPVDWQGARLGVEYFSKYGVKVRAAYYMKLNNKLAYSFSLGYTHDGGVFRNLYTNSYCDKSSSLSGRFRLIWNINSRLCMENILSAGWTDEGGYAYHEYNLDTQEYYPVNYNDPCSYKRKNISESILIKYSAGKLRLTSITSYQYLNDNLNIDNDFTTKNYFVLSQKQREHNLTQEIIFQNQPGDSCYEWKTGLFGFLKFQDTVAPVYYKDEGINDLILGPANAAIHQIMPMASLIFDRDNFDIPSKFYIPAYGAAMYHESKLKFGRVHLTAGLRADYEYTTMDYDSSVTVGYRMIPFQPEFSTLNVDFSGRDKQSFWVILPKFSAQIFFDKFNLYATVSRGYKTGGFNTQIFADIMQKKMIDAINNRGVVPEGDGKEAQTTRYKPELSWNYEIGTNVKLKNFSASASLFWIECKNQQVTIIPAGSTGRMMSNAARSRSWGAEAQMTYNDYHWMANVAYGYTNARFRKFVYSEELDYSGNILPYAPEHTVSASLAYTWHINRKALDRITLGAQYKGIGRIYWEETNTLSQPLYSLLSADLTFYRHNMSFSLWGRNLTNTDYNTFYFRSVNRSFFSKGRPYTLGFRFTVNL